MDEAQKELARATFAKIAPIAGQAGAMLYEKMLALDLCSGRLFKIDIETQGVERAPEIATAIANLHRLGENLPTVRELGGRHVGRQGSASMSPFLGRIGGLALVAAAFAPAPAGAATVYQMTNLSDVIWDTIGPGDGSGDHTQFVPTGINDFGTIIGTAWSGPLDRSVVALINPGLSGATTFAAGDDGSGRPIQLEGYKVNNLNDFVGDVSVFINPYQESPTESFIWAGGLGHILDVAPGVDNKALGVNDSRTVIGGAEAVAYRTQPPFTLGVTTQIPELTGDNYSVEDINDSGVMVGTLDANYFDGGEGFIDKNGVVTTFSYPGAIQTYANGISNSGLIVGTYWDTPGYPHGYIYDKGYFINIALPNDIGVYLEGVNDAGQIVGEYASDDGVQQDGFLLTPVPHVISDVVRFIGELPPTPTLFGPIELSLVDKLPLKEFRVTSVPEPSTWAMMTLDFASLGFAAFARGRKRPAATV